ncbi:MAG: hypothetical protein JW947_06210 [Sedimentisphaerales bacterium]|nr:hypothetical protein [Sedimentisphaerales bacterium]
MAELPELLLKLWANRDCFGLRPRNDEPTLMFKSLYLAKTCHDKSLLVSLCAMGNLKSKTGIAENDKNPLREALHLFLGLMFIIPATLIIGASKGQIQWPFLAMIIDSIIRAAFVITFLIAYHKKLILAWWTALLFFPATLFIGAVLYIHLFRWGAMALYGVMCFVFICHLAQRYKPYKNFIDKAHS